MKNKVILLLACMICLHGFSQQEYKKVHVSKDIELIQLSENAWVHVSWHDFTGFGRVPCNGLIFTNKGEAFLFDTPATDAMTMELVSWMKDSMNLTVAGFVPNHWHSDCLGGLGYLKTLNITSYASQKTVEIAKSKKLPLPDHAFKDSLQLKLGNQRIDCYYFGAAHSLDNIVVWIPSEKILFAGCMVKSMASTDLGNTADGDLTAYSKTLEKVICRFPDARIVIPGHGDFGGPELIRHTLKLISQN